MHADAVPIELRAEHTPVGLAGWRQAGGKNSGLFWFQFSAPLTPYWIGDIDGACTCLHSTVGMY